MRRWVVPDQGAEENISSDAQGKRVEGRREEWWSKSRGGTKQEESGEGRPGRGGSLVVVWGGWIQG